MIKERRSTDEVDGTILIELDISSPESSYTLLAALRQRRIEAEYSGERESNVFWANFETLHLVEETAWVSKQMALPLAQGLFKNVSADKTHGSASIPMGAHGKLCFYRCIHALNILDEENTERLKSEWQKAIEETEDPIERLSESVEFSMKFDSPDEQKKQALQCTEKLMTQLTDASSASDFFDENRIRYLSLFCNNTRSLDLPEATQQIVTHVENLYKTGVIHEMDPYVAGITIWILRNNIPDIERVEGYVDSLVSQASKRVRRSFETLVRDATDGSVERVEDEIPDSDVLVGLQYGIYGKEFSDSDCRKTLLRPWLESQGIPTSRDPELEHVEAFDEASKRYDTLVEDSCRYYLGKNDIDKVFRWWSTLMNPDRGVYVLHDIQRYALEHRDFSLLRKAELIFKDRLGRVGEEDDEKSMIRRDIEIGYVLYVSSQLDQGGNIDNIWLIPKVVRAIKKCDIVTWKYIQEAAQLPRDHKGHKLGQRILKSKLLQVQSGEKNDGLIKLLRTVLFLQTGTPHRLG